MKLSMKPILVLALGLSLANSALANPKWVLSAKGFGPLHAGMSPAQASKALGEPIHINADEVSCAELPMKSVAGLTLMFENHKLTRIGLSSPSRVKTNLGIGIGATEAQVKYRYRPLVIEPHKYDEAPSKYLTYWVKPERQGILFETDIKRIVRQIYVGNASIRYVEGCY